MKGQNELPLGMEPLAYALVLWLACQGVFFELRLLPHHHFQCEDVQQLWTPFLLFLDSIFLGSGDDLGKITTYYIEDRTYFLARGVMEIYPRRLTFCKMPFSMRRPWRLRECQAFQRGPSGWWDSLLVLSIVAWWAHFSKHPLIASERPFKIRLEYVGYDEGLRQSSCLVSAWSEVGRREWMFF